MTPDNSEIIIYQTEDGLAKISVRLEDETVWLTQADMVELLDRDRTVIGRHINNAFHEGELDEKSNMHFLHIANSDKPVAVYNLDVIISVGYRVKSLRGVQYRQKTKNDLTPVERDYLASIKDVQKKLEGKTKKKRKMSNSDPQS